jgi:hypothetical protein
MSTFTRIAAATLLTAGFATASAAEEWTGPRVVGTGDNASVVYAAPSANVVGGALTRIVGSGESATVEVVAVQSAQRQGRVGRVVGTGENLTVTYAPAQAGG